MNEAVIVLESIRDSAKREAPDLCGDARLDGDHLILQPDRLSLTAEVLHEEGAHPSIAHVHVTAHPPSGLETRLEACTLGVNPDRSEALVDAGRNWLVSAGGAILSQFNNTELLGGSHFSGTDHFGVPGCHGYAGRIVIRNGDLTEETLDRILEVGLFHGAECLCPPGLIHLVKVTLNKQDGRCRRSIEINGHDAVCNESNWAPEIEVPRRFLASAFAVFHFADRKNLIEERRLLDDALTRFIARFGHGDESLNTEDIEDELQASGVPRDLSERMSLIVPEAAVRLLFDEKIPMTSHFIPVAPGGEALPRRTFLSDPIFGRASILLSKPENIAAVKEMSMFSATFNAVNNALNAGCPVGELGTLENYIPEPGATAEDVHGVVAAESRKWKQQQAKRMKWRQFWK